MPEQNGGSGFTGSNWAAASVCSSLALALGGAFSASYVRDQSRVERAIVQLEDGRESYARFLGRTEQRLSELEEYTRANREMIEMGTKELDDALQREMRILDDAMKALVQGADERLQTEIQTLFGDHSERIKDIRNWIETHSATTYWTREDQERFESKLGLTFARQVP